MPIMMEIKATAVNPAFLRNARRPNFKSWKATESLWAGGCNHGDRRQIDSFGVWLSDEHALYQHLLFGVIFRNEVRAEVAEIGELKRVLSRSCSFRGLYLIARDHFSK